MVVPADFWPHGLEMVRNGTAVIDRAGQLRHTIASGLRPGSFAGNLHPTILEGLANPASVQGDLAGSLGQLKSLSSFASTMSSIAAVASIMNIGVSIAGFAIMSNKLDRVEATLRRVEATVGEIHEMVKNLPDVVAEKLLERLSAQRVRDELNRLRGMQIAINGALNAEGALRESILGPAIVGASGSLVYFDELFKASIAAKNPFAAEAAYFGVMMAQSAIIVAYAASGEVGTLVRLKDGFERQVLTARESMLELMLGGGKGLLATVQAEELRGVLTLGVEPIRLSPDAARDRFKSIHSAVTTNLRPMLLLDSAGRIEGLRAGQLGPSDGPLLQNNFRVLERVIGASLARFDELDYAPYKAGRSMAPQGRILGIEWLDGGPEGV